MTEKVKVITKEDLKRGQLSYAVGEWNEDYNGRSIYQIHSPEIWPGLCVLQDFIYKTADQLGLKLNEIGIKAV